MSKRSDKFIGGLGDTRELPRVERNATEILGPTAPVKFNHSGEIQLSNVEIKSLYFIPLTMKEKHNAWSTLSSQAAGDSGNTAQARSLNGLEGWRAKSFEWG